MKLTATTPVTAPKFRVATAAPAAAYNAAKQAWLDVIQAESKLPLQNKMQTQVYLHDGPAPKGTLVMYHGFTAGPWQFEQLAKQAYADGYNVVIPRLPGHGYKDAKGVEDPSHLLDAKNWRQYEAFGDKTYAMAKALGGPVSTLGLSVGGDIALDVAERHDVAKVVAYAPFLRPIGFGGTVADVVHVLDKLTFGLAGKALHWVGWGWGKESERQTRTGERAGHSKFSLGTLYGAAEFGRHVIADAGKVKAKVEYVTTGADDAADEAATRKTFETTRRNAQDGWYFYPKAEGIPHPMVAKQEDHGKGHTPALYDMTLKFLDGGEPANR